MTGVAKVIRTNDLGAGRYSKGLWFRKIFISKGHYSEDFYPEGLFFQRFLSRRVIIPKDYIPKGRYSEIRNNDHSE